jgi:hypothetical protein
VIGTNACAVMQNKLTLGLMGPVVARSRIDQWPLAAFSLMDEFRSVIGTEASVKRLAARAT